MDVCIIGGSSFTITKNRMRNGWEEVISFVFASSGIESLHLVVVVQR